MFTRDYTVAVAKKGHRDLAQGCCRVVDACSCRLLRKKVVRFVYLRVELNRRAEAEVEGGGGDRNATRAQ